MCPWSVPWAKCSLVQEGSDGPAKRPVEETDWACIDWDANESFGTAYKAVVPEKAPARSAKAMKHRCDAYHNLGMRCPGRHSWEEEDDDDDCEEDDSCGDNWLMLPERSRTAAAGELFSYNQIAAEMFMLDIGGSPGPSRLNLRSSF